MLNRPRSAYVVGAGRAGDLPFEVSAWPQKLAPHVRTRWRSHHTQLLMMAEAFFDLPFAARRAEHSLLVSVV